MNVVYYLDCLSEDYLWMLHKSAARLRSAMPHAHIILLTTDEFPDMEIQIDEIRRMGIQHEFPYPYRRMMAHATVDGDCLFLDADCIVQRDASRIFEKPFDVALCARYLKPWTKSAMFNGGVSFSRCPQFWRDVAGDYSLHSDWSASEKQLCKVAMDDRYCVRVLNGAVYNYWPESEAENVADKAIVHYKGARKLWMMKDAA